MSRLVLLLPLLAALGCAGGPEARPTPIEFELAPVTSADVSDPRELTARQSLTAGDYEAAVSQYAVLARAEADPIQRAEYLFFAAEAYLGAGEDFEAYEIYRTLVRSYPGSPRFPLVIERLFLIGRRFCEGVATKPSWLAGLYLTDREFGIQILERFQQARERHPLADDALHWIGVANESLGEYELAIAAWQKIGELYPRREWVETAEYRSARVFLAMSDGVEYDKRPLYTGLARLRRYVQRYPTGDHVAEANEAIAQLEGELAGHQFEVAEFYLRRDRDYAADIYLTAIQRDYPDTEAAVAAKELQDSLPATSPPPPPPDPDDGIFGERFRRLLNPTPPTPLPVD